MVASIYGPGAILSLLPIAYASFSLSKSERNYAVTDLETLADVWALSHFHYYLYGHQVTIYTHHAAVTGMKRSQLWQLLTCLNYTNFGYF